MSWIEVVAESQAEGELATIYQTLIAQRGKVANILKVHSLRPAAMRAHLDLYMELMFGPGRISRAQREMIAVVVSAANRCDYCIEHHIEALMRYKKDRKACEAIAKRADDADLLPRERLMLDYAYTLTLAPEAANATIIGQLRDMDYSDEDILHITLITAYFNFVNRIALGLGVEFSSEEVAGYKG